MDCLNESWGLSQLPIQRCQVLFAMPTDSWDIFPELAAAAQNLWDGGALLEQQLEMEQNCTWNGSGHPPILGTVVLPLPGGIHFNTPDCKYLQRDAYLCFWCLRLHCGWSRFNRHASVAWMSSPAGQDSAPCFSSSCHFQESCTLRSSVS